MYEYMCIVTKKLVYKPHNNNLCPEYFLKIFEICLPYRKYFITYTHFLFNLYTRKKSLDIYFRSLVT